MCVIPVYLCKNRRETHLYCVKYDAEKKACERDDNPAKRQLDAELVSNGKSDAVATDNEQNADSYQQLRTPDWQVTATHFTTSTSRFRVVTDSAT